MIKNYTLLAVAILAVLLNHSCRAAEAVQPNFVVIVTDDQRYDMLGCTGHPVLKTPHIDRLAREGMLFRNFFDATPLCSPSRACYLTGLYAHRHGVTNNDRLGLDIISHALMTFPRRLREKGYETAFLGKWHMGGDDSRRPGFDRWVSFRGQGVYLDGVVNDDGVVRQLDGYMTDYLNQQAVDFVRRPRKKPFCLVVAHKAVHVPYLPAPRHEKLYPDYHFRPPKPPADDLASKPVMQRRPKRKVWYEMEGVAPEPAEPRRGRGTDPASVVRDQMRCLTAVDEGVGQLLKALERTGQLDHTFFCYTSDNGYLMGEHGQMDAKRWAYDESVRVPLVVRYPAMIKPGTVCDRLTVNVDLAPTILAIAGVKPVTPMHGQSLVPLFRDPAAPGRSAVLTEYFLEKVAPKVPSWQAVRSARWKYIHYTDSSDWDELYDLQKDPHEIHNLASDAAAAEPLAAMKRELQRLRDATP